MTDANVILAALESRKWDKTWCGGCGVTYYRCGSCSVGVHVGRETTAGDCGGHRKTPYADTCSVAAAQREINRLALASASSSPLDKKVAQATVRAVRDRLSSECDEAQEESDDYLRGVLDGCNDSIEALSALPASASPPPTRRGLTID